MTRDSCRLPDAAEAKGLGVIQPSEFVKLGVIIYLAQVYTQKQAYIDKFLVGVMPPLIMVGVIFGLDRKSVV